MQQALQNVGVRARIELTPELVGPPLIDMLSSVLGKKNKALLFDVLAEFKRIYDGTGYQQAIPYDGVRNMLYELKEIGVKLYIATNKRLNPTHKIMKHLGWEFFFDGVYSLDYFNPVSVSKEVMLENVLTELQQSSEHFLYVGDREEDADAAEANVIGFIWAAWGYGTTASASRLKQGPYAVTPQELPSLLQKKGFVSPTQRTRAL